MKYYRMLLKKPLRDFVRMSSDVFMDGRKVKCAHVQNEAPTIVFENGFCSGVSCMKYWDEVFISLAKEYTLFAYDRVDTVIENEVLEDTENHLDDTVDLVKKLLQAKGLESPYILVGHSLGGLYMQYFAKKYAHEVRGIVLVDAVYPNGQLQGHVLDDNIAKIGKHILQMPKKLDIPIVVLSATQEALKSTKCDKAKMVELSVQDQKKYADLYPDAKQIWVECGHLIQYEKPDAIVDAIDAVMSALAQENER